jgi:hypothetical protein
MITVREFLEGTPMGYVRERKKTYIAYKRGVGTYLIVNGVGEWTEDVDTDVKAQRVYHNIKGEKMVKVPDELDIPKELKRKMTPEIRKKLDAIDAEAKNPKLVLNGKGEKGRDFLQPKGMSDEEWTKLRLSKAAAKAERVEAKRKERAEMKEARGEKRPSREGLVGAEVIAKNVGLPHARDVRVILRSIMDKPEVGWAWPPEKVKEIETLVKKHMKKEEVKDSKAEKKATTGKPTEVKKKGKK